MIRIRFLSIGSASRSVPVILVITGLFFAGLLEAGEPVESVPSRCPNQAPIREDSTLLVFQEKAAPVAKPEKAQRTNPAVLALEESRAELVRALVPAYIVIGDKIGVLLPKEDSPKEMTLNLGQINKLPDDWKLAVQLMAVRMAVVSASFPHRAQVEEIQKALHLDPSSQAGKGVRPRFRSFHVQRRTLDPNGKVRENWTSLDFEKPLKSLVTIATDTESESPALRPLIFPPLVMKRPELAGRLKFYPDETRLVSLRAALVKLGREATQANSLQRKLAGEFDIFENSPDGGKGTPIPDHCLVRFLDITIESGFVYEYRVRMRLANPNFGEAGSVANPEMAKVKVLEGPWKTIGNKVDVTGELLYYAMEVGLPPRDPDEAVFQVHRWLDFARLNPQDVVTTSPFGEWAIAETTAHRGEYIGKTENAEVPMWHVTQQSFIVPVNPAELARRRPGTPAPKGISVNFNTGALLVDFEGGQGNYRIKDKVIPEDQLDVQVLVLSPEGKLVIRHSKVDLADKDRRDRITDLETWIGKVKNDLRTRALKIIK